MTDVLRITGGKVYDPANGVDGVVRDVTIVDGAIIAPNAAIPSGPSVSTRTIDASGMVVMPGGVDIHCHIASAGVNRARAIRGEEHATHVHHAKCAHGHSFHGGTGTLTPSTHLTGYRYAALGYTSALEAAVSPSAARQTHLELDDTPNIDAGFLVLVANHEKVIELLSRGDDAGAVAFIGELVRRTGACGIKVVNPGGVAAWRENPEQHTIQTIDDTLCGTHAKPGGGAAVTPRRILETACAAAEALKLPHAPHVHCNRLGLPGNADTTLGTLKAIEGRRVHLTHLQFHAYGKSDQGKLVSGVEHIAAYLNAHANVTADVGQLMFGDAVTITGDTALEHLLWKLAGTATKPYVSIESELEAGCGIMPLRYSDKQYLHSVQWAIGLELMLTASDPWRMMLSTDHPNGGSFLSYPAIIAQLMNKSLRDESLSKAHPGAASATGLKALTREYTLGEIAIITRAAPARTLGWKHKGHFGAGADGDVTIYHDLASDPKRMFESPRWVIKGGRVIVEDGELRDAVPGRRIAVTVTPGDAGAAELREWFDRRGSYDVSQFGLRDSELRGLTRVN